VIYLDNNASTNLDPAVHEAVRSALGLFGNPSSMHTAGREARRAVEQARDSVARLVGAGSGEIFFTSGGTESNAMAIHGMTAGRVGSVLRSGGEHPSVREPIDLGFGPRVRVVDPEASGALDASRALAALSEDTLLVSVMLANNEYGALYPVAAIAAGCRERGVPIHTDAVQAAGRVEIDVERLGVDLLSLSAHKVHGPRGAGALYVRRGLRLVPRTSGGGQEGRLRAGTENTAAIVGFGVAARIARERLERDARETERLRDRLESGILERVPGVSVVGGSVPRLPNTSAIRFDGARAETLLVRLDLDGICASAGSACSSGTLAPSPALLAMGLSREQAREAIRFSLSRETREEEIDRVLEILPAAVAAVRSAAAGRPAPGIAVEPVEAQTRAEALP
jgi:cysteine desulfurase